jgi:CRISPR-associated protein Cas2
MTIFVVTRVTQALRGRLSRWTIQVHPGVFVGTVSSRVRERLWNMILGLRRLGACTMIWSARNEQGFSITTAGDSRRVVVNREGLALVQVTARPRRVLAPVNPIGEGCGGDLPVRGPDEAAKLGREAPHPECTVLPTAEEKHGQRHPAPSDGVS